jgi:aryl carrier-like protein
MQNMGKLAITTIHYMNLLGLLVHVGLSVCRMMRLMINDQLAKETFQSSKFMSLLDAPTLRSFRDLRAL